MHRTARRLRWLKWPGLLLAALCFCLVLYCVLVDSPFTASALEPAIVGTLWGLVIFTIIQLFHFMPLPAAPASGFFSRLLSRVKRGLYQLLAVLVISVVIVLIWMSARLLLV